MLRHPRLSVALRLPSRAIAVWDTDGPRSGRIPYRRSDV
jgi:hypothetical protein